MGNLIKRFDKFADKTMLYSGQGILLFGTITSVYGIGTYLANRFMTNTNSSYEGLSEAIMGLFIGSLGYFIEKGLCKPRREGKALLEDSLLD